jgi:type IV pilus assembly protein PilB
MNTASENPPKTPSRRNKLGDILLQANLIDQNTLGDALQIQKSNKKKIGQILIDMGVTDDEKIAKALAGQLNIPFLRLSDIDIPKEVIELVPQDMAENYLLLPIKVIKKQLVVVMANPLEFYALDDLRFITRMDIFVTIAPQGDILTAIQKYYPKRNLDKDLGPDMGLLEDIEVVGQAKEKEHNVQDLLNLTELPPVVRFTNSILADAIKMKASDIHIEPQKDNVVIRYRIDGILREIMKIDKQIHLSLVSRIKIISNMDISIRRKPQDGRSQVKMGDTRFDLRISTIPASYGEKVTIRVLNPSAGGLGVDQLGFSERDLRCFKEAIDRPQGIILVTGPTGSGKSSTLYTALKHLNSPDVNIVTVEDPVEFDLPGINQVQINPKAGITFADALRSILRQDPDIVMVGEIRDSETAKIAFQAAQTGHLVLSTLHTNDAPSAVTRLLDMGIDSFVIADSLLAVLGQRLVRGICKKCKMPDPLSPQIFEQLEMVIKPDRSKKFWKGAGCEACQYSGYAGRLGIFELLMVTPAIKEILSRNVSALAVRKAAEKDGYTTLSMDGINKAIMGLTTNEEVFRVAPPEYEDTAQESPDNVMETREHISAVNGDESQMPGPPSSVASIRPEKILIVDDNPVDIKILKNVLEYQNFSTVTAGNGEDALKIAVQEKPDLIITDYLMPEMDGKMLVAKLKSQLATRFIPIIMLTAKDEVEAEIEVISVGANDYLAKPVNPKRLIARINRLLSRSSDASECGE